MYDFVVVRYGTEPINEYVVMIIANNVPFSTQEWRTDLNFR